MSKMEWLCQPSAQRGVKTYMVMGRRKGSARWHITETPRFHLEHDYEHRELAYILAGIERAATQA